MPRTLRPKWKSIILQMQSLEKILKENYLLFLLNPVSDGEEVAPQEKQSQDPTQVIGNFVFWHSLFSFHFGKIFLRDGERTQGIGTACFSMMCGLTLKNSLYSKVCFCWFFDLIICSTFYGFSMIQRSFLHKKIK
ncbi:hypothetical protein CROQUDRAFT_397815 [Cronartium quercuum f. sp. fusiforme G11]|uniref:Uncharacterized protein n=1 Tax=Cronartium quercuum f. sp. fusiforme G11 TaxID=708437 RepID=A0A9P6NRZ5_9BASI|nr:hypothetical protein CROQUDRAFT_397815 [Cronartium quercuum f. sp. fusiforme G11]